MLKRSPLGVYIAVGGGQGSSVSGGAATKVPHPNSLLPPARPTCFTHGNVEKHTANRDTPRSSVSKQAGALDFRSGKTIRFLIRFFVFFTSLGDDREDLRFLTRYRDVVTTVHAPTHLWEMARLIVGNFVVSVITVGKATVLSTNAF